MTADDYEAALHGIDLPNEVQLYTGVKIVDVPKFIEVQLDILRSGQAPKLTAVAGDRLARLLEILAEDPG
jgi:hypothetical protein